MHPWRERLNRWFTPVARRLPLSPNTITLIALCLNLVAAVLLLLGTRHPALFLVAMIFVAIGGFADALDGVVARLQQKETRFGDFLDHICDRISDTALAAFWMIGNRVRETLVVFPIVSFILFSNGWSSLQLGGATIAEWLSILLLVFALIGIVQRIVVAQRMERS